jgi:hypothetical protein
MAQQLTLRKNETPTVFNKEMAIGIVTGLMVLPHALFFAAIGGIIGGIMGKSRMQKEQMQGKTVSDSPSFWNKNTLLGGMLGSNLGLLIGVGISMAIIGVTAGAGTPVAAAIAAGETATAKILLAKIAPAVIGTMLTSWLGGTAIGAWIGGKHGQSVEREEFAHAAAQQQMSQEKSRAPAQEVERSASPAYSAQIERERELAAAQQNAR